MKIPLAPAHALGYIAAVRNSAAAAVAAAAAVNQHCATKSEATCGFAVYWPAAAPDLSVSRDRCPFSADWAPKRHPCGSRGAWC